MEELSAIVKVLMEERDRLNIAIAALQGVSNGSRSKRRISAAGRARIVAAQRARWAKVRGQKVVSIARGRRKMSGAAIARIRAAQKARWAKWRKQQKSA